MEDIYFFEVNTKYISSNVNALVKLLIVSTHEMVYFWYLPKKKCFFFLFFSVKGKKFNFFQSLFSLILLGSVRLKGIILGVNAVFT